VCGAKQTPMAILFIVHSEHAAVDMFKQTAHEDGET
jgi:hypothetical protein